MESLSRPPHRRKHSTTDAFSRKNPYDDVLLFNGGERESLGAHEYAEIFSGSSSIPVLDLSGLDERVGSGHCRRSSRLDYSNIFGGFNDVAVPYEELVNGSAKKTKMRNPTETKLPSPESNSLNSSGKPEMSSGEASDHSVDEVKKKFNLSFNRTSQRNTDASNGKTHVTQLHDVTGFTCFVDGNSQPQKTEDDRTVHSLKREVSRTWSFSAEVETVKGKGGLSCDKKNIPDKSHNVNDMNLKLNFSKVPSLSSGPLNINGNNYPAQSRASNFVPRKDASEKIGGECSPPYFGENFDENSVAAASAAALKKAIDQAQESIRLAKMVMDRKKEGCQNGSKPRQRVRPKGSDKECNIYHDSNGSKNKTSEAKYEELDPTFTIFSGIDGKITPTPPCNDTVINAAKFEVESVWENVEAAKEHGTAFSEGDNFSSIGGQSKSPYIDGKVETETSDENVKAAGTHSKGADFHVLVANECKTSNVAGGLETGEDNSERREVTVHHITGPEVVAEPFERALDTSHRMQEPEKSVEEAEQCQATFDHAKGLEDEVERVLDTSQRSRGQENILCEAGKNLRICQEDEVSEERETDKDEKGKQETAEMLNVEHFTEIRSDFYNFLNESCNLGENETKRDENGHVAKTYDDEAQLWFESEEQLKEARNEEIDETKTGIFPEIREVEKSFNETLELEVDNQKENHAHDQDKRKVFGELEQNRVEERLMNTSECEAPETMEIEAEDCGEVPNSAVFDDSQETNYAPGGAGKNEESLEEHIDEAVIVNSCSAGTIFSEAQTNDTSSSVSETRESYDFNLDNKSEEYQRVVKSYKGNDTISEVSGTFSAIDKVEEAEHFFHQEDNNEISGTETLRRIASEEIFIERKLHDSFDSLSSDGKMENVRFMDADPEEELPEDGDASNTTSEIHDVAQENTSESNRQDLSQVLGSDIRTAEFNLVDVGQVSEKTSESDEGSASTSSHENINGFSPHESEECAENANDMTPNNEIKDEPKPVSSEIKFSDEQSEPKEVEKSMGSERSGERGLNTKNDNKENLLGTSTVQEKDAKGDHQNFDKNDYHQRIEAIKKGREREKDRIVVERAIREARERAFAEAREKAERAAVERAAAEARQRAMAEAREKLEKASTEAKLRAERAAVERATAEARERALEKAMSQKTHTDATERFSGSSKNGGLKHSFSSSDLENGTESAQRRKARLERHQRIMERAAKALAEKNTRDLLAQKEQAERNRIAESLDAEIKRWATGKERNLRALLSTLQYILGPDSGWQPIPLTEIVTTAAVKKAYRKATLYVHPDKLQQRGASIHQKYLCEKVFDLLKAAWNRFNSDER